MLCQSANQHINGPMLTGKSYLISFSLGGLNVVQGSLFRGLYYTLVTPIVILTKYRLSITIFNLTCTACHIIDKLTSAHGFHNSVCIFFIFMHRHTINLRFTESSC